MRRTELDICRLLGCLAVLVIHASSEVYHVLPLESAEFIAYNFIATAMRGGVPLFFMLSGALLLPRETMEPWHMLKTRTLRLAGLFCFWSALYAALRALTGASSGAYGFAWDFFAGHYHLWFLPVMMLVYLYMPVAHAAIHRGGLDGRYLLFLFAFSGLLMKNLVLTAEPAPILDRIAYNFGLDYLPYLGYAVLGWHLAERSWPKKTLWLAPLAFLLVTLLAARANRWYSMTQETADGWLFSYFSLPSFLQAVSLFCFCLALKGRSFRHAKLWQALSDATLGVYLIHPLVLNVFERFGLAVTRRAPMSSLLMVCVLLTLSCFALVLAARRVPLLRRLL